MRTMTLFLVLVFAGVACAEDPECCYPVIEAGKSGTVAQHLQDVSVTIRAGSSQGSGVVISRDISVKGKVHKVNFVWTAAHVIDGLRSTRKVVGPNGQTKTLVEFRDVQVLKEDQVDGRKVGEHRMDAKVLLYSDSEHGHDLALLMVRKYNFAKSNACFAENAVHPVGTKLIHVGSLLGQAGSNSMTTGNVSQTGRLLQLGNGSPTLFDQTSCPAFPGSSGGGVFLENGRYMGMLVRGAGETFNFVVPVRRMYEFAEKYNVLWALDAKVPVPKMKDILEMDIEHPPAVKTEKSKDSKTYGFKIYHAAK